MRQSRRGHLHQRHGALRTPQHEGRRGQNAKIGGRASARGLPRITSMSTIQFGTDGWRAVIGESFTFANLERAAQATADYWSGAPVPGTSKAVVVGYDRRFLSPEFGRRVAEVF